MEKSNDAPMQKINSTLKANLQIENPGRIHSRNPLDIIVEREEAAIVSNELGKLTQKEQEAVEARLMSDGKPTLEIVGAELGISREAVRQRQKRGVTKLQKSSVLQELVTPESEEAENARRAQREATVTSRQPEKSVAKKVVRELGPSSVLGRLKTYLGSKDVEKALAQKVAEGNSYGGIAHAAGISYEEMKRYVKKQGLA